MDGTFSDTLVDENTSSGFPGKSTVFIASLIQTMPIENQVCHWQLALVRQHLFERLLNCFNDQILIQNVYPPVN